MESVLKRFQSPQRHPRASLNTSGYECCCEPRTGLPGLIDNGTTFISHPSRSSGWKGVAFACGARDLTMEMGVGTIRRILNRGWLGLPTIVINV